MFIQFAQKKKIIFVTIITLNFLFSHFKYKVYRYLFFIDAGGVPVKSSCDLRVIFLLTLKITDIHLELKWKFCSKG